MQKVLSRFSYLDNHMASDTTINTRFKHSYDKTTLNLIGHIKAFYKTSMTNTANNGILLKEYMKYLCCFGCSPIPLGFASSILPAYNQNQINELFQMGFLNLTEESIQLSALMANAVFAAENPSPQDYDVLVIKMKTFLTEYDQTLYVPYLSDILYVFMRSLYDNVPIRHNPAQQNTSDRFEKWQDLAYYISLYYRQNNAPELSLKVTELIKYPDSLHNKHNLFEKVYINLENKMQMNYEPAGIVSFIDNLITQIQSAEDEITTIDLSSTMINALNAFDTMLGLFCQLCFRTDNSRFENGISYIRAMKTALKFINRPVSIVLPGSFKEKKQFYNGCYRLITNFRPIELEYCLTAFNSFQNMDYRIRGLSLIIFLQSHYALKAKKGNLFKYAIKPRIYKLDSLIRRCKLIPIQTLRLCLYAYTEATTLQYLLINQEYLNKSEYSYIPNNENLHNLLTRCNLSKETLEQAMIYMKSVSSEFENTDE